MDGMGRMGMLAMLDEAGMILSYRNVLHWRNEDRASTLP